MKPEAALQAACWTYAQHVLPPEADYASVETKVGRNDKRAASFRKMMGVRAGQPDAQLVWQGRVTFIEFKAGSAVSDVQRARHAELMRAGSAVRIVRAVADLRDWFVMNRIPLRHHSLTAEMRDEMLAARRQKPTKPRRATPRSASKRALTAAARMQQP